MQTFTDFLDQSTGRAFTALEANMRMASAFRELGEAAKEGAGKGINENTEAGERNLQMLMAAAKAAKENAATIRETTGNHQMASEVIEQSRAKFLAAADAMGVEKGRAVALANSLFGIPNINRTVKADTGPARSQVSAYRQWLASVNLDKTSTVRQRIIAEQYTARGGPREFNRWGGVYEHAAEGVLREAQIAAPVSPARYAWAEPATGGEAFIPRHGNPERSLDILSRAARWYGQQIIPATASLTQSAGTTEVRVFIGDQELRGMVRVEVADHNRGLRRRVSAGAGR
ncbi:hypothetical protein [Micromonospora inyonensis]|uniref:Uncharacterized protein n=1 Tax=Micromonospora inyonensis TaxID=47866 RepID=A0A1C6RWA2_9ACTN|nr:hypothetical protein [Micromonospora inyonensis]SCL21493.1 hypothetical protein GA0074694_3052 [Micromonospora inyonensis]